MSYDTKDGHTLTPRRTPPEQRVVVMPPSPWRRRKRLRTWVAMGNAADVLMILMFTGLLMFACWETQVQQGPPEPKAYRSHVRPGGSVEPLPEVEPPKP